MIKPVKGNDGWKCPACSLPAKKKKNNVVEHIQYKHVSPSEWKCICPKAGIIKLIVYHAEGRSSGGREGKIKKIFLSILELKNSHPRSINLNF